MERELKRDPWSRRAQYLWRLLVCKCRPGFSTKQKPWLPLMKPRPTTRTVKLRNNCLDSFSWIKARSPGRCEILNISDPGRQLSKSSDWVPQWEDYACLSLENRINSGRQNIFWSSRRKFLIQSRMFYRGWEAELKCIYVKTPLVPLILICTLCNTYIATGSTM